MTDKPRIIAILGSTRLKSANRSILEHISKRFSDRLSFELSEWPPLLPHFNADFTIHDMPVAVGMFREEIEQADGVLICTPEYVFSVPGIIKNAIEWTVSTTLFSEKPVAIITASSAGEKAHESLVMIMRTIYARVSDDSTLLISGVKSKMDESGAIKDEEVVSDIDRVVNALLQAINEQ